jgi:hypothetical protein
MMARARYSKTPAKYRDSDKAKRAPIVSLKDLLALWREDLQRTNYGLIDDPQPPPPSSALVERMWKAR